jgi:nucleoside-diphosphate-sugar epimerase
MRILITGSSGQLGAAIAASLALAHSVVGLDILPGPQTTHLGSVTDHRLIFRITQNVDAIIHTASLHARHLHEQSRTAFVETNIQGTLNLLEAAVENGVPRFIYTSTTSLYGQAMVSPDRAVWVTEEVVPQPRDIYDVTKLAAEGLCQITAQSHGLPCLSLRVSRFFPERAHLMAIYRLYRGVDVSDATEAHRLALTARVSGFEIFNISAHSPFVEADVEELRYDAAAVIRRYFPWAEEAFARRNWSLPERIDRVYVTGKAEQQLGYRPRFNFESLFQESGS